MNFIIAIIIFVRNIDTVFNDLKKLLQKYKDYVRVDLVMYVVMILMIVLYFIYTVAMKG
jgi:hypothetical protein